MTITRSLAGAALLCLAVGAGACTTQPGVSAAAPARASSAADSAAIAAAARAFSAAYVRGDAASMASLYTDDAVIFPDPGAAIQGRDAIRRYWTLPAGRRITMHELLPDAVELHGDVAHDHGRFRVAGEANGESWGPSEGKYLVVWRRGADGQWRMQYDMWNRGPRPPSQ